MRSKPLVLLGVATLLLPGCYYAHLARGQLAVLRAERPIAAVLADPATDPEVRESLALVGDVLRFATSIGLRVDGQYRQYAPWPGDRVVTALVATRPGHIEPAEFWFPLIGDAPYKGFFELARAEREAAELHERGLATCLLPVPAYSTLGWFEDPVTEPMLQGGRGPFVETLLHELVHATVFVAGNADWNESVATFVGEEAVVRFFADRGDADAAARERVRVTEERAIADAVGRLRARVASLYAAGAAADARAALEGETRHAIAAMPLRSRDAVLLADSLPLSDPCLALYGAYEQDIPTWAARLEREAGDLVRFVAAARAAAKSPDPHAALAFGADVARDAPDRRDRAPGS